MDNCGRTVDTNVHTFKPNSDIGSSSSVDSVDVFTPCLKNLQPSKSQHTTTPINSESAAKRKTFEIGDRVVVKDVGGIYQAARGQIVDILYSRAGASYLVRFDKPVKNVQQFEFEASDLMKL